MCPSEQDAFDLIEALALCGPLRIIRSDAVCLVEETDSTNSLALEPGPDGAVYLAERQRTGRGRFGRSWHSAPGLGLWFSVRLTGNPDGLLFAAGLAMRDALGAFVPVSLKWPNDIMSGCRKICGMLLERRDGRIALGIGVNVLHRPEDFPPDLRDTAGSLAMAAGGAAPPRREAVFATVLACLDRELNLWRAGAVEPLWRRWIEGCGILGRQIHRNGLSGRVVRIDPDGALIVQTKAGAVKVRDGDIVELE
ncbi:MAG TPA: biotin--[acetyl-CoA-carboxylase] ligase [Candidatus Hydrogenedentes bacterium]|nr:biotin--[acetyl-CoA-carboxylase] ligase [Candidatus Hydrogenedentota bacterium]